MITDICKATAGVGGDPSLQPGVDPAPHPAPAQVGENRHGTPNVELGMEIRILRSLSVALLGLCSVLVGIARARPARVGCANAKACFAAGMKAYREKRLPRALRLLRKACQGKHGRACLQLGNLAMRGVGQKKAAPVGFRYYQQACATGLLRGCFNVGVCHYEGVGTKRDYKRALPHFMRACAFGHGKACFNAGVSLLEGRGTKKDPRRGWRMFALSCRAGHERACALIAARRKKAKKKSKKKRQK